MTFKHYFKEKKPQLINLAEKHLQACEETKNFTTFLDTEKAKNQVYDDEETLKQKQYSESAIKQIKSWRLTKRVSLPNLEEKKKVGVVKVLAVSTKKRGGEETKSGIVSDELTFLVPSPKLITVQNFPSLLTKKSKEVKFFYTD